MKTIKLFFTILLLIVSSAAQSYPPIFMEILFTNNSDQLVNVNLFGRINNRAFNVTRNVLAGVTLPMVEIEREAFVDFIRFYVNHIEPDRASLIRSVAFNAIQQNRRNIITYDGEDDIKFNQSRNFTT